MNQYKLRQVGYKDDEDYIRKTLAQKGIKYNVTVYGTITRYAVLQDGLELAYYDFSFKGELRSYYSKLPEIEQ